MTSTILTFEDLMQEAIEQSQNPEIAKLIHDNVDMEKYLESQLEYFVDEDSVATYHFEVLDIVSKHDMDCFDAYEQTYGNKDFLNVDSMVDIAYRLSHALIQSIGNDMVIYINENKNRIKNEKG